MWATQTLKRSRSMSSETRASARWAALRKTSAGSLKRGGRGRAAGGRRVRGFAHEAPESLHEAPGALHALLGPDHVALRGRIGEHEPARGVGAVAGDDVVGGDGGATRVRHLLNLAHRATV